MWRDFFQLLFWSCLALSVYAYIGYPLLIITLGMVFRSKSGSELAFCPTVTVVLAAHNENERIVARLENLLNSNYPASKLDIIVVSDGSTDSTAEKVNSLRNDRIRIIEQPQRSGKAACLNTGVAVATGDIVVFCDVRQRFEPETIPCLAKHFQDERIGAASGALEIDPALSGVGSGVDAYWKTEKLIRYFESVWDSSIGCTGAVYAIRRDLYRPLPVDTLLDDVVIPMVITLQGFRVIFERSAVAFDPQALEPERERVRKQRTLAGNFQMLFRYAVWLLPWRNRLWWQLISHKYLRLISPVLLILMFTSNAILAGSLFFQIVLAGQCAFYAAALLGSTSSWFRWKPFSVAAGFLFLNCMVVQGFRHYLRDSYKGHWPVVNAGTPLTKC